MSGSCCSGSRQDIQSYCVLVSSRLSSSALPILLFSMAAAFGCHDTEERAPLQDSGKRLPIRILSGELVTGIPLEDLETLSDVRD